MEVALRIVSQYWQLKGSRRHRFIAFEHAYHGDTAGAASLGASAMFGGAGWRWNFPVTQVSTVEELAALPADVLAETAALVIEPMVQGAAGIRVWPSWTLKAVREWCDRSKTLLIADEVLTGFGRTGRMFACDHEGVSSDIMVLGKALTGGYLPLAITLVSDEVFRPFCAGSERERTLFYGHSYTGNALGCAAAKASLEIFHRESVLASLAPKIEALRAELEALRELPWVADVRQCGFIAGIELHQNEARPGQLGAAVCLAARRHGLLTRPIRDVIVLMPPFCVTLPQLRQAVQAIKAGILEVCEQPVPA
jgi:adenosylmethionine-8-amino-7-oxononanoate aminotransferase